LGHFPARAGRGILGVMSSFQVTPEAVSEVSARLGGISGHVADLHGRLGAHADAGHGTATAGALDGLMGRWVQVLPVYALAGERLAAAVAGAAEGYRRSDAAVADDCGSPPTAPKRG